MRLSISKKKKTSEHCISVTKLGRTTRADERKLGVSDSKYTLVRSTNLEDTMRRKPMK